VGPAALRGCPAKCPAIRGATPNRFVKAGKGMLLSDVRVERVAAHPVDTAARLLFMSKKLDGHEKTPIRAWWPDWLDERIPELEDAILLIEEAERHQFTVT
jgi:hypothetical protein